MYVGTDPLQIARVSIFTRFGKYVLIPVVQAGVYFTPVDSNGPTKYVPRSVQIDLEVGVCNRVSVYRAVSIGPCSCGYR